VSPVAGAAGFGAKAMRAMTRVAEGARRKVAHLLDQAAQEEVVGHTARYREGPLGALDPTTTGRGAPDEDHDGVMSAHTVREDGHERAAMFRRHRGRRVATFHIGIRRSMSQNTPTISATRC